MTRKTRFALICALAQVLGVAVSKTANASTVIDIGICLADGSWSRRNADKR